MATVVRVLPDDVSTDVIYPGRYMATVLPSETPQFAFADDLALAVRLRAKEIPPGSVIVAGKNFGCGSSREQAVSALVGHDLAVVAESFARIFLQNAVNLGLRAVAAPGLSASEGDDLAIEPGHVTNRTTGQTVAAVPLPPGRQAIIDAGGLIPYTRKRLLATPAAG
jgi:3-isopropylmalate/(R)-2-methylmalate dehydratase small subunit